MEIIRIYNNNVAVVRGDDGKETVSYTHLPLRPKILGPVLTSFWLTPPPIPRRSWCRFGICSAGLRTGAGP